MYLKLDKKKENPEDVWYLFFMSVAGDLYLNEKGERRRHIIEKKGICIFNKKTEDLIIDWSETDDYFKGRKMEPLMMQHKLKKYNKIGEFPDIVDIATG
jgi:hypothetical protein